MDLCLQLIISDTEERKKAVEGVSQAAQITARKMMVQQDYFGQHLRTNDHFEEAMVKLFMNIIKFYAKAARYFARNTLSGFSSWPAGDSDWAVGETNTSWSSH
jgi:aspartate carbamoyltransferase catalytic subunit